jgi:hypothetical protein
LRIAIYKWAEAAPDRYCDHRGRGIGGLVLALILHQIGVSCSTCYTNAVVAFFDDIDKVIPTAERHIFIATYKAAAGFAIDQLNSSPTTIETGI